MEPRTRSALPRAGETILVEWRVESTSTGDSVIKKYKAKVSYILDLPKSRHPSIAIAAIVYPAGEDFPSPTNHTVHFVAGSKVKVVHGDFHTDDKTATPWIFDEDDPDACLSEIDSDGEELGDPLFDARSEVVVCRREIAELKAALANMQHQIHNIGAQVATQEPALSAAQRVMQSVQLNLLIELGRPPRQDVRKLRKKSKAEEVVSSLTLGTLFRAFIAIKVPCSYKTFQDILKDGRAQPRTSRTPPVRFLPCYPETARPQKSTMSYHAVFLTFSSIASYIGIDNEVTRKQMLYSSNKDAAQILGTAAVTHHRTTALEPDVHLTLGASSPFEVLHDGDLKDDDLHYAASLVNKNAEYMVEKEKFRLDFERVARGMPKKMDPNVDAGEYPYSYFHLCWSGAPSPHARFDSDVPFSSDPPGTLLVSMPVVATKNKPEKALFEDLITKEFLNYAVREV